MSNMLDRSSVVVACLGYGGCVIVKRESLIENDAKRLQLCCFVGSVTPATSMESTAAASRS